MATEQTPGRSKCGARKKKSRWKSANQPEYCEAAPVPGGSGRCHWHGGKSLRGLAAPSYRTGLYAKDAPIDLADRMQAALEDPTFGTVVSELQLLRAKIAEITSAPSGMTAREFRVVLTVVDRIDRLFRTQMKRDLTQGRLLTLEESAMLVKVSAQMAVIATMDLDDQRERLREAGKGVEVLLGPVLSRKYGNLLDYVAEQQRSEREVTSDAPPHRNGQPVLVEECEQADDRPTPTKPPRVQHLRGAAIIKE